MSRFYVIYSIEIPHIIIYNVYMSRKIKTGYPICSTCKIDMEPIYLFFMFPNRYIKYECKKCGKTIDKKFKEPETNNHT